MKLDPSHRASALSPVKPEGTKRHCWCGPVLQSCWSAPAPLAVLKFPISRHMIAAVMCLVVIALRGPGQFTALSPGRLFAICLQLALFGLLFAALAYGVGAWSGRRVYAIAAGAVVAVLGYLGDSFFTQIDSLRWMEKFSPFDWYLGGEPLKNGVQWGHTALLTGLAVLFVAAGTWRYNQRDIAV